MKLAAVLGIASATVFEIELSNDIYNLGITRDLRAKQDYDRLIDTVNLNGWVISPVFGALASSEDIIRRNAGLTGHVGEPYFDFEMVQLMRRHNLHRQFYIDTHDNSDIDVVEANLLPNSIVVNVNIEPVLSDGLLSLRGSGRSAPKNYADCTSFPCQGYLYKDEIPSNYKALGVNASKVWEEFGVKGEGVSVIIQEAGLIRRDLHNEITQDFEVISSATEHGSHATSVGGVILSRHDNWGTEGIAPNVERYIELVWTVNTAGANHYEQLMKVVKPGDVLNGSWQINYSGTTLANQQKYDPYCATASKSGNCMWSPALNTSNNRAYNVLADLGVTVILCAGNGGANMNTEFFHEKHPVSSRGPQTVAVVTAWNPLEDNPFSWSSYMSDAANSKYFLDVQFASWGGSVVSTTNSGTGYTTSFDGCSSASPIVTGTALLVQSAAKKYLGAPLPPQKVIDILYETGNRLVNSGPNQYQDMSQVRSPDAYEAVKKVVAMANETEEPTLPSTCYPSSETTTTTTTTTTASTSTTTTTVPPVTTTTSASTKPPVNTTATTTTTATKPPVSSGCGSVPPYVATQTYPSKCTDVCHDDKVWTSKWYVNPGDIPGLNSWGGWHDTTTNGPLSGC